MPTLEELFKTKVIADGPNAGKTAQQAYEIRNSKESVVTTNNFILQAINKTKGKTLAGQLINQFDFIEKINDRRQKFSIKEGESFVEEEQVGLKQWVTLSSPLLYGGDMFRIQNGRTRTLSFLKRHAGINEPGGPIANVLGETAGNYASDYLQNVFTGKRNAEGKIAAPPPPDATALGTNLAIAAASTLGDLLMPLPMVPSKVAEEIQQRGNRELKTIDKLTTNFSDKSNLLFAHEYNRDKALIKLKESGKVPNFFANVLKSNANVLSLSKDALIATGTSIVKKIVATGTTKLINKTLGFLTGQKKKKNKQNLTGNKGDGSNTFTPYSIAFPYSNVALVDETLPFLKQSGLKGMLLQRRYEEFKTSTDTTIPKYITEKRLIPNEGTGENDEQEILVDNPEFIKSVEKERNAYSTGAISTQPDTKQSRRGITSKSDGLNLMDDVTYPGITAIDSNNKDKLIDDFDFIPLKFYSIALNETVQFRCSITDLSETFTPEWESHQFIGNPFPFYTYNSIERTCSFSFKIFSMSLIEHINAWRRLSVLGKLTMPQQFKGDVGAITPPLIKFTLGDMYREKDCFIETLTFNIDNETPWEIGLNKKLMNENSLINFPNVGAYIALVDPNLEAKDFKLPMVINAEVQIKFLESRSTVEGKDIYSFGGLDLNKTYDLGKLGLPKIAL